MIGRKKPEVPDCRRCQEFRAKLREQAATLNDPGSSVGEQGAALKELNRLLEED